MKDRRKDIGERIRQARKAADMSQEKLAEALNISLSHMSDIENGKTNLGLEIFMNITEALQVSADWLLRTDVPIVNDIYQNEMGDLLSDCTPGELQVLIRILKEIKSLTHS